MQHCYLVILTLVIAVSFSFGQAVTTAVPFLLVSPSAELSGMGEATVALKTDNEFALFWNPAHLGSQSFNNYGGLGFSATEFYPDYSLKSDYSSFVFSAGINLSHYFQLPVGVSFGMGYSSIVVDLGNSIITGDDPTPLGTFESEETSHQYTVGTGIEYWGIRVSAGITEKSIKSDLTRYYVHDVERAGTSSVHAIDLGVLVDIPVLDLVYRMGDGRFDLGQPFSPFINASFGLSKNNIGDEVAYIDAAQGDPLPRTIREGLGFDIGCTYTMKNTIWKPFSFRWTREASDLLVRRWGNEYDTTGGYYRVSREAGWEYRSGVGDINFFQDVLWGKSNSRIQKRTGWEVNLGELFSYRRGKLEDQEGNRVYQTEGYGIQLRGFFKFIAYSSQAIQEQPIFQWVFNHIDLRYNHCSNSSNSPSDRNRTYNDYLLVVQN